MQRSGIQALQAQRQRVDEEEEQKKLRERELKEKKRREKEKEEREKRESEDVEMGGIYSLTDKQLGERWNFEEEIGEFGKRKSWFGFGSGSWVEEEGKGASAPHGVLVNEDRSSKIPNSSPSHQMFSISCFYLFLPSHLPMSRVRVSQIENRGRPSCPRPRSHTVASLTSSLFNLLLFDRNWGSVWRCTMLQGNHPSSRSRSNSTSDGSGSNLVPPQEQMVAKLCHRSRTGPSQARVRSLWNEFKVLRGVASSVRAERRRRNGRAGDGDESGDLSSSLAGNKENDPDWWHPNIVKFKEFIISPSYASLHMNYYPQPMNVALPEHIYRDYFQGLACEFDGSSALPLILQHRYYHTVVCMQLFRPNSERTTNFAPSSFFSNLCQPVSFGSIRTTALTTTSRLATSSSVKALAVNGEFRFCWTSVSLFFTRETVELLISELAEVVQSLRNVVRMKMEARRIQSRRSSNLSSVNSLGVRLSI